MDSENILLNIEFNNAEIQNSIKQIVEGRKVIDSLIEANKKLVEQGKKNSEAYVQNEAAIKSLNTEVSNNSKIVQANSQAVKANADSIEDLKKKNSELLKERNKISTATEEGRKQIAELNAKYDENSKIIAANSTQVEKQRFNIGNYSSALSGISPQLGAFSANLGTAQKESGGLTAGLGSMTKAALGFIATPLGAVIAAIVLGFKLLTTWLTNSTSGLDFLEDVTTSVSAVIQTLKDNIDKLVGAMVKLATFDLSGAISDFAEFGDEVAREVKLTLELNSAIRELEDAEINYEISVSKTSNKIKELLLQSKNRTLSEKERIKILEEADKLEAERVATLIKNRQEALRIANEDANKKVELARIAGETEDEFAQRLLDTGKLLDDQRDKVKDAVIDFNNALGDGITVREKIQNQQDALAEKAEADAQKRRDKAKAEAEKAAEDEKKLQEKKAEADKQAREADFENRQEVAELLRQQEQETADFQKGLLDQALLDFQEYTQGLINEKKRELLEGVISQEEYNKELEDLELATLETQRAIKAQFSEEDLALDARITDQKIANKQREVDINKAQEQAKLDAVKSTLSAVAGAMNKQSVAYKVIASTLTIINTIESAIAAFKSMAVIPIIGPALGAIAAAAASAAGLAAVAKINSTPVPKMAEGGLINIDGKRHAHGGEKVTIGGRTVAEVEGGEKMVILKRGTSPLLKSLGIINRMAGGVDFYNDRSPKTYLADGGFVARSAASQVNNDLQIQSFAEQISKIKIYTSITELERVQTKANRATVTSELS